jgi:hypothetical protein
VYHGSREHIFWLAVSWQVWEIISWAWFSAKFLIERAPSAYILNFGTLAGSWPLKPMERRGSKLGSMGFFYISMKFLIESTITPYIGILDFGRIREQATGADDHESQTQNNPCAETFPTSPYMSHSESRNSTNARKDIFFLVRVLVKARFSDSKATNPKSRTVLFTTRYQRNYAENFIYRCYKGWEIGDGRTDDKTISIEPIF